TITFSVAIIHFITARYKFTVDSVHDISPKWVDYFPPPSTLDCTAYLEGEQEKIRQALVIQKSYIYPFISDDKFVVLTKDCDRYKRLKGYFTNSSKEEKEFPIAFSILLYKEAEQAEKLLQAIYRPQNLYCLHIDRNSPSPVHTAMAAIAKCFDNVFIVSKSEKVVYAGFSRLKADINCMEDLVVKSTSWKYFLNLPSQAFPLKTNAELVKILKIYNGSNDIEGITGDRMLANRYRYKHILVKASEGARLHLEKTEKLKERPPHNITIVKGSAYGVFSRAFVEFLLTDKFAVDLLKWCEDIYSPDEYFWATLHHQGFYGTLRPPGGYSGEPDKKLWLAMYASWSQPCHGRFVRGVCVFGLGDIARLTSRKELFANKFYLQFHPFALHCMADWIRNKSLSNVPSDLYYYRQLSFINAGKDSVKNILT
ncbi:beta-1,3-galactosyl-O-glycosyl-glycoprotein beta-1,6-N-acetylglucosaminyltransferase 3-like, partial [Liolophura sinensis]|uniref:beta-1,3-galactosyl-O-glycosyl-glycoprotein beta-1,6-N-acetylglucosaminyltransferase 3-like n=1 Tax=Liolophura sinensis TaxID=3198878 RepID=UPI003158E05C